MPTDRKLRTRREIVHLRRQGHWMFASATCGQAGEDYWITDYRRKVTCLKCKRATK